MRLRDQVALTLPTFFLRVVLGITFLWAGTGKLVGSYTVTGDDAARLANIGVMGEAPAPSPTPTQIDLVPLMPADEILDEAADEPVDEPADEPAGLEEQANEIIEMLEKQLETESNPEADPGVEKLEDRTRLQTVQYSGAVYAGSDFPEPVEVKRVYSIALMLLKASDPGLTEDSQPIDPIMPAMLGSGSWAKALAWAVALTEIAAGAGLLLGLLTRLSALSTLSVMLVALWMTQFGPAVIQSSDAILGFIPRTGDSWSPGSYSSLLWQLALAAMSGSVFFLGSGALGIDRLIFKPSARDPYIHGDPKNKKAAKSTKSTRSTEPQQVSDRDSFDRTPNATP